MIEKRVYVFSFLFSNARWGGARFQSHLHSLITHRQTAGYDIFY